MTTSKGSVTREWNRRTRLVTVRLSDREANVAEALVERTGLSAGALIRRALLDKPETARRPSTHDRAVQRLLAALGKIGSNVNQLAGHADAGSFDAETAETIHYAVRDLAELRFVCLQALGYETPDGDGDD